MNFCALKAVWKDLRGAALIEGAILLPVLFVLIFGVFEFSWYFYNQHRVSTGIRDAARYIARSHNSFSDPTLQANAKNLATMGDVSGGTPRVAGWTASDVVISISAPVVCAPVACRGGPMQDVVVSTSFTPTNLGFLQFLQLGPFAINITHTERLVTGGS